MLANEQLERFSGGGVERCNICNIFSVSASSSGGNTSALAWLCAVEEIHEPFAILP